jgi:hypothetical protein
VISALLAAGILKMRGIGGKPGWFWLFLIEGLLTFLIGFAVSLVKCEMRFHTDVNAELFIPALLTNSYQGRDIP